MENAMPIGCLPVSFYPRFFSGEWTIPSWAALAQSLGLDYIDVNALFFDGMDQAQLAEMRKALPVPVYMVSTYSDFTHPDESVRRRQVADAIGRIDLSAAIGARYVRLTAGQHHPGRHEADAIRGVYDCFAACVRAAEKRGLTILIENHSKPGAWQYPDFNFHTERFLNLWHALKELPVSVNFDVANAWALERWETLLAAVAGRIATLHVNDLACVDPLVFCCVGDGVVDIEAMLRAIFKTGFRGPLSIEEAGFAGEEGLCRAIRNTRHFCQAAAQ